MSIPTKNYYAIVSRCQMPVKVQRYPETIWNCFLFACFKSFVSFERATLEIESLSKNLWLAFLVSFLAFTPAALTLLLYRLSTSLPLARLLSSLGITHEINKFAKNSPKFSHLAESDSTLNKMSEMNVSMCARVTPLEYAQQTQIDPCLFIQLVWSNNKKHLQISNIIRVAYNNE